MKYLLIIALTALSLNSCSSDSDSLATNACASLGLNTRIINGTECLEERAPVVRVYIEDSQSNLAMCSGVLISQKHVLTAAHCFFGDAAFVFIELHNKRTAALEYALHPKVRANNEIQAVFNDVAIVTLAYSVNSQVLPLVLSQNVQANDVISIFGYGLNSEEVAGTLHSGEMRISEVTSSHLMAPYNGEGSNTCSGDSGGPAILAVNTEQGVKRGIVGIVSTGKDINCAEGDTTYFTNLQDSSNLDFILELVPEAEVI